MSISISLSLSLSLSHWVLIRLTLIDEPKPNSNVSSHACVGEVNPCLMVIPGWFANREGRPTALEIHHDWSPRSSQRIYHTNGKCLDSTKKNTGYGEASRFAWTPKTGCHRPALSRLGKVKVPCPLATGSVVRFPTPNWDSCPSWYSHVDYHPTMSG